MLIFSFDKINAGAGERDSDYAKPFQPGDVYLTKYMGLPLVTVITDSNASTITTILGVESIDLFKIRAVCYLGRRSHFLGLWLPWARLRPTRLVVNDEVQSTASDARFWSVLEEDVRAIGIDPETPLHVPVTEASVT